MQYYVNAYNKKTKKYIICPLYIDVQYQNLKKFKGCEYILHLDLPTPTGF